MPKQLLIYQSATPITVTSHKDWSVQTGLGFGFAAGLNSMPLAAVEFATAALDMAIVFSGTGEAVFPSVLLGTQDGQNLFLGADGAWTGSYVPAFLRRYPFVFADPDDKGTFTFCLDEAFAGLNRDGRGERLFDRDGIRTQYLTEMMAFVISYQGHTERTTLFCQRLVALKVLDPMQARFAAPDGTTRSLSGFFTINRDRFKALPQAALRAMFDTDELELCYLHLQSLHNIHKLTQRAKGLATGFAA
jgi:hypothetical protein